MSRKTKSDSHERRFIEWFRACAPYVHVHRGRTFVIAFEGDALRAKNFRELIHDISLLHSLGIRLVLVAGARPQIEERIVAKGAETRFVGTRRVTDDVALACAKEAVGAVRVEIEGLLSMGLSNSPMANAHIRVMSGNFVSAKPVGVVDGIDLQYTGAVRRVDADSLRQPLDGGAIVLLSTLGYSPTGDVFNLTLGDVAASAAIALRADKLVHFTEGGTLRDGNGQAITELTPLAGERLLQDSEVANDQVRSALASAVRACTYGVRRAHVLNRHVDGAMLLELFTRDGIGTLITNDIFEGVRAAVLEDVGGVLNLIDPLQGAGQLLRRSRERLEVEIEKFSVIERDGLIIACAGLYLFPAEAMAEVACLAVHPDYRSARRGDTLVQYLERQARQQGIKRLFALTTQASHWFIERGFREGKLRDIPASRRSSYQPQRNSKILIKKLG